MRSRLTRLPATAPLLIAAAALAAALTGCASSSCGSPAGKLVYQPHYGTQATGTLAAGDMLGRSMFEQGAVVASRSNAELRYAGVLIE